MAYELCTWGFIVGQYVAISSHPTREAARAALDAEYQARELRGQYTDLRTFSIRETKH